MRLGNGYRIVAGVKANSHESGLFWRLRSSTTGWCGASPRSDLIDHFTGFGLYDRTVVEYSAGSTIHIHISVASLVKSATPLHECRTRSLKGRGITKNNFYTLYDLAMLGSQAILRSPFDWRRWPASGLRQ